MTPDAMRNLTDALVSGDALPRRVMVDALGHAVGYHRALTVFGVIPTLCFIREDGWSLACPNTLAGVAFGTWPDKWVALVQLPPRYRTVPCDN